MSMDLSQKNIGIAITGSYCTYKKVFAELEKLASTGANLYPIFSDHASTTDSRFGKCADFLEQAEKITGKKPITTIPDAEPIGPGPFSTFSSSHRAPAIHCQNLPTASLTRRF